MPYCVTHVDITNETIQLSQIMNRVYHFRVQHRARRATQPVSFEAYLADVPGLDVLQFNEQLFITACLELLYKYPAVSRLLVRRNTFF